MTATPFMVTFFDHHSARFKREMEVTLPELREMIETQTAERKSLLPWIKFAVFGNLTTNKGSLRHDANIEWITGCEADYDGELISFDEGKSKLEKAGVEAIIYTSPSHLPDKPRYRILCRFSEQLKAERRTQMVARLNGLFHGTLDAASFILSQSYYYGHVVDADGNPVAHKENGAGIESFPTEHREELIEGQPLDLCDELDRGAIGKSGRTKDAGNGSGSDYTGDFVSLDELIDRIKTGESLHPSVASIAGKYARKSWPIAACIELVGSAFTMANQPRYDGRWDECVEVIRWVYAKEEQKKAEEPQPTETILGEWDAGDDVEPPEPRGWLLGNIFCRKFLSMLIAVGGTGKTALRYAQYLSLAIGRSLTGEFVFQRCRVLVVSLEDDAEELRRRILAARLHHNVSLNEVRDWLFLAAPGIRAGKLLTADARGKAEPGKLAAKLEAVIVKRRIDLVALDPFIKSHGVPESDNNLIDQVAQILVDLSHKHNIAVDAPHHARKGSAEPGDAEQGRGASAAKDAARLNYTLTTMTPDEAKTFNVPEDQRRYHIRLDSSKVNPVPPQSAKWLKLVGVRLGNATELYPNGDEVQTVESWQPPEVWAGLDNGLLNRILDAITAGCVSEDGRPTGERFSNMTTAAHQAWEVVQKFAPDKTDKQCRAIITAWVKSGLLLVKDYDHPIQRKPRKGVYVDDAKRPGTYTEETLRH